MGKKNKTRTRLRVSGELEVEDRAVILNRVVGLEQDAIPRPPLRPMLLFRREG